MYRMIRTAPEKGEELRKKAIQGGFLDTSRKIRKVRTEEGNFLEIPVTESAYDIV
ncbi:MAG: class I SAM-dependent methyltransferase family protein, partial [Methanosarcina vacuolata]|nr:class I SAM-dependent methyltransferase family protein [Methanosarcina vacuolata]